MNLLPKEEFAEPFGAEIAGNAESMRTMRLGDAFSGFLRLFKTNTLKFCPLGLSTGCDPLPMLVAVSSRQHRSRHSELLTIGCRARD